MKFEDVKFKHDRMLLSYEKEGSPTICNNIDRIWGHYVKWNVKTKIDKYYMKNWTHRNRVEWWLPWADGCRNQGNDDQKVQTNSQKVNDILESNL